jgi:hypothetical protein
MVPVHERLHQQTALTVRRVEGALDRFRGASERLLAEDVLAASSALIDQGTWSAFGRET